MKRKERLMVWLAGIISSDGSVTKGQDMWIGIFSKEKEWLEYIKNKIKPLKFNVKIHSYSPNQREIHRMSIRPAVRFYHMLYKFKDYFLPRKWKRLEDKYGPIHILNKKIKLYYRCLELGKEGLNSNQIYEKVCKEGYEKLACRATVYYWAYGKRKPWILFRL